MIQNPLTVCPKQCSTSNNNWQGCIWSLDYLTTEFVFFQTCHSLFKGKTQTELPAEVRGHPPKGMNAWLGKFWSVSESIPPVTAVSRAPMMVAHQPLGHHSQETNVVSSAARLFSASRKQASSSRMDVSRADIRKSVGCVFHSKEERD